MKHFLKKKNNTYVKLIKIYRIPNNLPTQKSSVNTVIGYFKEYPDHKYDKKKDLVIDIIDKKIGLKNEVCNLLSVKKYRCIHTNLDFNISRLNRAGFLEKQDDCFRITKEGLKHVNDDNKTLNYIIEEKLNKDKPKVNDSDSISSLQLRHNTYNNIILNLLDNEKEYKRKNIIHDTIKVLIPDYSDERTIFDLFAKPIKKSINNLLNDELIQRTEKHGYYKITQKGHELISDVRVNIEDKTRHEDNVNKENIFDNRIKNDDIKIESAVIHESESKDAKAFENKIYLKINPSDIFKKSYIKINKALPQKLLEKVKSCDPYFFEKLSLDLLKKMDFYKIKVYTGSLTSKSNDGGVDGVIYTDPLSIKPIYFQSKRWENSISRPEMQKFVGALHDRSAETGVFITTSDFTKGALKTARSSNIRLINGEKLVELMIKYKLE